MDEQRHAPGRILASVTRLWLPLAIAVAGIVLIVVGQGSWSTITDARSLESGSGVALLIVAIIVWMINWMYRLSLRSNADREAEERAREHFDRTGAWPEDDQP